MGCGVVRDNTQSVPGSQLPVAGLALPLPRQPLPVAPAPAFCHESAPSLVLHTHLSHGPTDERSLTSDWGVAASQQTDSIRLACKMSSFKKCDLAAKIKN